jgi:hypothetical protein
MADSISEAFSQFAQNLMLARGSNCDIAPNDQHSRLTQMEQ